MNPRLLKDLDARAAMAKDDHERLLIRAERAGVLARVGRITAAREELTELRRINSAYRAQLTAWILFAEGLIVQFESMLPGAQDRFQRAYAIATSIGDHRLQSESAAWIAFFEYQSGEIDRAFSRALDAIEHSSESDHAARSRAHLVLADCYNSSGLKHEALVEYANARRHATELGDLAMQSSILYNQAADDLARLSLASALGIDSEVEARSVELLIGSVATLDKAVGLTSLPAAVAILHAQLSAAKEDWRQAVDAYDSTLDAVCAEGHSRLRPKFLAERAYCLARLGEFARAKSDAEAAASTVDTCGDADDLAIAHGRLSATFRILEDQELAEQHARSAQCSLQDFRNAQAESRTRLASFRTQKKKNPAEPGST
jgi:tetratricopeptide (TPR) repeat protein